MIDRPRRVGEVGTVFPGFAEVLVILAGHRTSQPTTPPRATATKRPPAGTPQANGGDSDPDNNGGPDDADGAI